MREVLRRLWKKLRPAVLWSFRRGSWQYDVICVAILAFIFLTPRNFFNDQPRSPALREVEQLTAGDGTVVYLVDTAALGEIAQDELRPRLERLISRRAGRDLRVVDLKPAAQADEDSGVYLVYARP